MKRRPHARADLVTVSPKGEPWAEFGLRKAFQRVLAKLELPRSRLHDLRHFFVTECFKSGASAPDVQALAGHKHLHVTQRYAHTDDESKKAAIAALAARIGNKKETAPREGAEKGGAEERKAS